MSRKARLISGAAVLAGVLVVVLAVTVVVPRLSASRATAAGEATARTAHDKAVTDYTDAAARCSTADEALVAARDRAASAASTDPSTMSDPTLLDKLSAAIAAAGGVAACAAPPMGTDTATIQQQTGDTLTAVDPVQSAVDSLAAAIGAVTADVQAKKDDAAATAAAAAAATQEAAAAAASAARTWHFVSNDGYSFDLSLQLGSPATDDSFTYVPAGADTCSTVALAGGDQVACKTAKLADVCTDFDPSTMVAIPVTATFTATTKGFDTPVTAHFDIGRTGSYGGPDQSAATQVEVATVYSGDGPQCQGPTGYGSLPSFGVSWTNPMKTGATGTFRFDVVLQKWRTPAAPSGDSALLDYLTVVPGGATAAGTTTAYAADSQKVLTLAGAPAAS